MEMLGLKKCSTVFEVSVISDHFHEFARTLGGKLVSCDVWSHEKKLSASVLKLFNVYFIIWSRADLMELTPQEKIWKIQFMYGFIQIHYKNKNAKIPKYFELFKGLTPPMRCF